MCHAHEPEMVGQEAQDYHSSYIVYNMFQVLHHIDTGAPEGIVLPDIPLIASVCIADQLQTQMASSYLSFMHGVQSLSNNSILIDTNHVDVSRSTPKGLVMYKSPVSPLKSK